jgi:hypothetical protein
MHESVASEPGPIHLRRTKSEGDSDIAKCHPTWDKGLRKRAHALSPKARSHGHHKHAEDWLMMAHKPTSFLDLVDQPTLEYPVFMGHSHHSGADALEPATTIMMGEQENKSGPTTPTAPRHAAADLLDPTMRDMCPFQIRALYNRMIGTHLNNAVIKASSTTTEESALVDAPPPFADDGQPTFEAILGDAHQRFGRIPPYSSCRSV